VGPNCTLIDSLLWVESEAKRPNDLQDGREFRVPLTAQRFVKRLRGQAGFLGNLRHATRAGDHAQRIGDLAGIAIGECTGCSLSQRHARLLTFPAAPSRALRAYVNDWLAIRLYTSRPHRYAVKQALFDLPG
jgi:hypothetical protein